MKIKKLFSVFVMLLLTIVTIAGASALKLNSAEAALPVKVNWVKVNGDELSSGTNVNNIDRNDEYEVKVQITSLVTDNTHLEDLSVEAQIMGYDHGDQIYDIDYESVGDLEPDHSEIVKFNLKIPYKLDEGEKYGLKITVHDQLRYFTEIYVLFIEAEEHNMIIKDVIFSPSETVQAGKSLLTTVYLKNIGNDDEMEGIKVGIDVPGIGSNANWIDELDSEEGTSSEQLYLPVPICTKAGVYDAIISVDFKEGDKIVTTSKKITVLANPACVEGQATPTPKTIITVGTATQDVAQGAAGAIYPLTLSNAGAESKTYVVSVDGYQDWATISMSPSNVVVVAPGEAKAVYVYVTALDTAAPGEHMFSLTVKSGEETLKQIPVKANVVAKQVQKGSWDSVKKGLEIGLIVLIVLLVILGLIIGFNKLRGDDEDEDLEEEESKTYY